MNDFTKEELKQILYCVARTTLNHDLDLKGLNIKIQRMFDYYCEHEWRKGVHLFNDIYCTKCDKHFDVSNCDHEWRCWDDEHNTRECMKCGEKREGEI